jgi:hypothetical protein
MIYEVDDDADYQRSSTLTRSKQFRILLLIVLGTFSFVAVLFFGLGYLFSSL